MLLSFFSRFRKAAPAPVVAAMPGDYRACDELGAITRPFSPLVGELLALYCHTRSIGALSQSEDCRDEYQMTARSVIHHSAACPVPGESRRARPCRVPPWGSTAMHLS
jgi:hypothetical protein